MLGSIIIYAVKENIIEGIENVRQSVSVYFLFCIWWREKPSDLESLRWREQQVHPGP